MGIKRSEHQSGFFSIPEKIEKVYYSHGLFCSSHPVPVICFASFIIIICCWPLLHLRLPGNSPQEHLTPINQYKLSGDDSQQRSSDNVIPKWFHSSPAAYILQIVIKSAVIPPNPSLPVDSYIQSSFKQLFDIIETIRNYQHVANNSLVSLDDVCLHVTESIYQKISVGILPQYGCLVLSPANLWNQDINVLLNDKDAGKKLFEGNFKENPVLKDILFGVPWNSVVINKSLNGKRASVFTYAISIVMDKYDANFTEGLRLRLQSTYSVSKQEYNPDGNITHVYFHDQSNLIEFIPLLVTYVILFFYIYFSVRKIELVKSKLGMAFSAVVTVIASLCMSIGTCTWFGLSFTLKSGEVYLKEIFPYLVVIIGLENILVLTKSIVSTPVHLDVKVRVAQGLSKEGWSITKNLCTELTILTFGFFTFVPAIQEFCLFAVVGLLSDFFLQLVFFATILSIDVRRMEQSLYQGIQTRLPTEQLSHMYPLFRCPVITNSSKPQFKKSKSSSRLNMCNSYNSLGMQQPPRVVTAPQYKTPILVPKRLRLVYFWARCRIFQRAFMVTFVVWLFLMSYRSGIVEHFTPDSIGSVSTNTLEFPSVEDPVPLTSLPQNIYGEQKNTSNNSAQTWRISLGNSDLSENVTVVKSFKLNHRSRELWRLLSPHHWPTLFGFYNISIQKKYISMLPPISLFTASQAFKEHFSRPIPVDNRVNPQSSFTADQINYDHFLNDNEFLSGNGKSLDTQEAIYPSSPQEVILTVIFAIPSLIFVVYVMIVLYRCVCTRNYAEWRSSWSQQANEMQGDIYTQLVLEAMPVVLEGHPQEIECMTTDNTLVVSSCLSGQLRVWDSASGECVTAIDRRRGIVRHRSKPEHDIDDTEDLGSDYSSCSPPSRSEFGHFANDETSSPLHIRHLEKENAGKLGSTLSQENLLISSVMPMSVDSDQQNNILYLRNCKNAYRNQPNLSSSINTDFTKPSSLRKERTRRSHSDGFDFSKFESYYTEFRELVEEPDDVQQNKRKTPTSPGEFFPTTVCPDNQNCEMEASTDESALTASPVWCLDCKDNLIAVGCSDGRVEIWDGLSGIFKCIYDDETGHGVTGVCIIGNRVIASRLHGGVDFLELKPQSNEVYVNSIISTHRRMHVRQGSSSSLGYESFGSWSDDVTCILVQTVRAHQQPITQLQVEAGRVVTGSQDHSLKVYRIEDAVCQLTLHGHHGPISSLFIDKLSPMTAASGAQDGAVCLWDLSTGACVCRLQGHDGIVAAVTYTEAYVLSAGEDTRLLVWERFQGHLLNTIHLQHSYCNSMVMLTDNLLLTAKQGSLIVWDIRVGEPVRIVRLGHADQSVFVRQIKHVGTAVVCDYGNQLRVVQFPTIVEKAD